MPRMPEQHVVERKPSHLLLTNSVQPVESHCFKSSPHHGILFQNLVEVVHREGVEPAVGIGSHTGCAPATSQQANFWNENPSLRTWGQTPPPLPYKTWCCHSMGSPACHPVSPPVDSTCSPPGSMSSGNVLHMQ